MDTAWSLLLPLGCDLTASFIPGVIDATVLFFFFLQDLGGRLLYDLLEILQNNKWVENSHSKNQTIKATGSKVSALLSASVIPFHGNEMTPFGLLTTCSYLRQACPKKPWPAFHDCNMSLFRI